MLGVQDLILLLGLFIAFIVIVSRIYYVKMGAQEYGLCLIFALVFVISYKVLLLILGVLASLVIPLGMVVVELSLVGALYSTIWVMGMFKGGGRYEDRVKTAFLSVVLGFLIYALLFFVLRLFNIV